MNDRECLAQDLLRAGLAFNLIREIFWFEKSQKVALLIQMKELELSILEKIEKLNEGLPKKLVEGSLPQPQKRLGE